MRSTAEMMLRSNEMIIARLERLTSPSLTPPDPAVGVVLERRNGRRSEPLTRLNDGDGAIDQSELRRRRLSDGFYA